MKLIQIIPMALQSFRVNPFHTFLSCLGIIIGVGALFSILSLADGMEQMARAKIAERANLKSFSIAANGTEMIDGLRIPKEHIAALNIGHIQQLDTLLQDSEVQMNNTVNTYLKRSDDTLRTGSSVLGVLRIEDGLFGSYEFIEGACFTQVDIDDQRPVIVISRSVAEKLYPMLDMANIIEKVILFQNKKVSIVGILASTSDKVESAYESMKAVVPITIYSAEELKKHRPRINIAVQSIESYESEEAIIMKFLDDSFEEGNKAFTISSYAGIMKDVASGMLIFKLIMGMIVGISVVVGGIGIMNVLLMSIKERTKEIGIRKAIGASASSIKWQFLMEALFLSFIGSALGVILGIGLLTIAMAVIHQLPMGGMAFDWAFSWGTTITIAVVAILIGLIFGTYPAVMAAKLDPIEAIRHE